MYQGVLYTEDTTVIKADKILACLGIYVPMEEAKGNRVKSHSSYGCRKKKNVIRFKGAELL